MGLPIVPIVTGIASLFTKKPGKTQAQKDAEAFQGQQLQSAQFGNAGLQALAADLARRAGYDFTPGSPAVAGTPARPQVNLNAGRAGLNPVQSFSGGAPAQAAQPATLTARPFDPFHTPDYANQRAGAMAPIEAAARAQKAQIAASPNRYGSQYRASNVDFNTAQQASNFNRQAYTQEQARQDQFRQQLQALFAGQAGGGPGAASALQASGQQQQATATAQDTATLGSLKALFEAIFQHNQPTRSGVTRNPNDVAALSGLPF